MTMVEPFNLNPNPVFAELMPRSFEERRAAYADPEWRQRVRDARGRPARPLGPGSTRSASWSRLGPS